MSRALAGYLIICGLGAWAAVLPQPGFAHEGDCDAKIWRHIFGMSVDGLGDLPLPDSVRVVYPDSTGDAEPDEHRLNIVLDADLTVIDLWCG